MSALPYPEKSMITGVFKQVRQRLFAFGCGVLLVIHWSNAVGNSAQPVSNIRGRFRGDCVAKVVLHW